MTHGVGAGTEPTDDASGAATPTPVPPNDPTAAFIVSVVLPGGGQLYVGDKWTGAAFFFSEVTLAAGGALAFNGWVVPDRRSNPPDRARHLLIQQRLVGAALGIHLLGMIDAPIRASMKTRRSKLALLPAPGGAVVMATF